MAINKTKNVNLQITISKTDNDYLLEIQERLSESLNIDLSKSQTISYLLKHYRLNGMNQAQEQRQAQAKIKHDKELKNYRVMVVSLKDKLGATYGELSTMLQIHQSTLKKYASGKQAPTGTNKEILDNAFKKYGIK